jgi:predicted CoA-binding protein
MRVVTDAVETLRNARSVLVIDWPSPDVPDSLVRAGHEVYLKSGPGPRDNNIRELEDGEIVVRPVGEAPGHVDLVYAYRPEAELPAIVSAAKQLGATALWWQSGHADADAAVKDPRGCWVGDEQSRRIRELAESQGLGYVDDVYIGDAARGAPAQ